MPAPKNILLIRIKSIGDVVLTLPAVHALRENFPSAKITYFTSKEIAPLLEGFREVDEIIALDRTALRSGNPFRMASKFFGLLRRLRAEKFSLVVDLQGNGESAWLARLTGAAQLWSAIHEKKYHRAFTHTVDRRHEIHAAEMHLELLRFCGLRTEAARNEFVLPAEALAAARDFFATHRLVPGKPTLFLQPLTSTPSKNWPMENFIALARHWQGHGWQIIFGGGPADRMALEPACAAGFISSAGVPLLVTGGLMQLASLVVGGDTGALHLAVAQGKQVVMLMNHDRPGRPHPFRHPDWALTCAKKHRIADIQLATVIAACERASNDCGF